MLNIHPYQESQKLIRCKVSSEKNSSSIRYIELENYKMWEYMVSTKHGLIIETDLSLCLWVHEEEYLRNEDVYSRAGNVSAVNRLMIMINDENHGYYYSASRFVASKETEMVKNILLSHKTNKNGDEMTDIEVIPGYTVEQKEHMEETITSGLSTAPLQTARAEAKIEILEEILD